MTSVLRTAPLFGALLTIWTFLAAGCSNYKDDVAGNLEDDGDDQDTTPPATITDLRVTNVGVNDVDICWTAPGDDGYSGLAVAYDIRWSFDSITSADFDSASIVYNVAFPVVSGGTQCHSVTGLEGDLEYWIAVKTCDEAANCSDMSNCVHFTCLTDSIVAFEDPALEQAIRLAVNRPSGPVRRSHLLGLTSLSAGNKGISDLAGIEYCVALRSLRVEDNQISDIGPLQSLDSLVVLNLVRNQIADISPLASSSKLVQLYASYNPIADVGPVAGLTNLTNLSLTGVATTDFSPLSSVTSLQFVDLGGNTIADLSALSPLVNMRSLVLFACHLTDISALSDLESLEELWVPINQIADVSPLSDLPNLTRLELGSNMIVDIVPLVNNSGLGPGDTVNLTSNPLSSDAVSRDIPALQTRGVTVTW